MNAQCKVDTCLISMLSTKKLKTKIKNALLKWDLFLLNGLNYNLEMGEKIYGDKVS